MGIFVPFAGQPDKGLLADASGFGKTTIGTANQISKAASAHGRWALVRCCLRAKPAGLHRVHGFARAKWRVRKAVVLRGAPVEFRGSRMGILCSRGGLHCCPCRGEARARSEGVRAARLHVRDETG